MEDRIIELETRLSFLEAAQDDLSDTLARHEQSLDLLTRKLERVIRQLQTASADDGAMSGNPADERPPHY